MLTDQSFVVAHLLRMFLPGTLRIAGVAAELAMVHMELELAVLLVLGPFLEFQLLFDVPERAIFFSLCVLLLRLPERVHATHLSLV